MDYESLDNAEMRNLIKIETEISKRFSGQRASLDSLMCLCPRNVSLC